MTKEITFEKARIVEVKHNLAKITPANTVPSVLRVVAAMTPAIAAMIGYRWLLFDKEKDVKNGYAEVVLDLEMNNLRVKFDAPKIDGLDQYVDRASKFRVYTKGGGKNKAKRLLVSFQLHMFGSPFQLLEYLLKVGGIEGTCRLMPRQEELFGGEGKTADAGSLVSIYEADGFTARIEVKETPAGAFLMTRRASGGAKKLNQAPPQEFASEADARQAGAIAVQSWADNQRLGGVRKVKAQAAKLVDWCATFILPQMALSQGRNKEALQ